MQNATSASITPGVGTVNATTGSVAVSPTATTTYTLTATGPSGTATQTVTGDGGRHQRQSADPSLRGQPAHHRSGRSSPP